MTFSIRLHLLQIAREHDMNSYEADFIIIICYQMNIVFFHLAIRFITKEKNHRKGNKKELWNYVDRRTQEENWT